MASNSRINGMVIRFLLKSRKIFDQEPDVQTRIVLTESEIPTHWYNVIADMPNPPAPYLGPDGNPVPPEAMLAIFPEALVMQEVSTERWIPIPDPVREALSLWRPSPLYRAHRLEKALNTPAKIYYKNEAVSPAGSHKPNTAVAQAYYNQQAGIKRLATETGAGQWGCSLALAGQMFGLDPGLHGQDQLSTETVSPLDDADMGGRSFCQSY